MAASLANSTNVEDCVNLCKFCLQCKSKYVCPRCGTPYCSVSCYKSENHLDCSEAFYQEWVEGELKGNKISSDGKKKMMEILSKISNEDMSLDDELDSDDDSPLPDLSERLADIDINDSDKVWENLSEAEQAAFEELINNGDIANLIPNWEPWWFQKLNQSKVTELHDESNKQAELEELCQKCPPIFNNIKPLSEITKIKPALSVSFDLVNILGSYSLTVRYFNGSHFDFPEEAAAIIHKLSKSLISPQKFTSSEMALSAVALEALICDSIEMTQKDIEIMKADVKSIMDGPFFSNIKFYMLSALSDLQRLFSHYKNKPKKSNGKFAEMFPNANLGVALLKKNDYKASLKRLHYLLSWLSEYGDF